MPWACVVRLNDNRGRQHFESSLCELFAAFGKLIAQTKESMLAVQEAVLVYLPNIIGDVVTLYDPLEFAYVIGILLFILSISGTWMKLIGELGLSVSRGTTRVISMESHHVTTIHHVSATLKSKEGEFI